MINTDHVVEAIKLSNGKNKRAAAVDLDNGAEN
jgi:hypothetical protein